MIIVRMITNNPPFGLAHRGEGAQKRFCFAGWLMPADTFDDS